MTREESIEKTKAVIADMIAKIGIVADIEVREQADTTVFNIRTDDSNILIGQYGINLSALQYVCRIIARRTIDQSFDFVIDVDGYKKKREGYLVNLAKQAYNEAVASGRPVVIKPMPAYERRAIHAALTEYADVVTDSTGEEPNRMVVVRLRDGAELDSSRSIQFGPDQDYQVV